MGDWHSVVAGRYRTKFAKALATFRACDFRHHDQGNHFFEQHGAGHGDDRSDTHERFTYYEALLLELKRLDPQKYERVHKGTPFFFLAWTGLDLRKYESALFYLDLAVAEDQKNDSRGWISAPAASFLRLEGSHAGSRTAGSLRKDLNRNITEFNARSSTSSLGTHFGDGTDFVRRFAKPLITGIPENKRTLVSGFYVWMHEFPDRMNELELRGALRGSTQPFLSHLFKGAVLFESLLKEVYSSSPPETLGGFFPRKGPEHGCQKDFGLKSGEISTSAHAMTDVLASCVDHSIKSSFETTIKLRNLTGHNLVRDDIFDRPAVYQKLVEQEMNALLYLISAKF